MLLLFYYVRQSDLILGRVSCYVAWPRWVDKLSLSLNRLASAIAWVILIGLLLELPYENMASKPREAN